MLCYWKLKVKTEHSLLSLVLYKFGNFCSCSLRSTKEGRSHATWKRAHDSLEGSMRQLPWDQNTPANEQRNLARLT